jgi:ABC-2 type transport system ATP-binding protein
VTAVIETDRLTKRYGSNAAVADLDLLVEAGEVFGLLGPNGAGKTTTILMLLGLTEPTSGSATVVGLDPTRSPLAVKRRVGYLPDSVGFYDNLTGRQNLRFSARLNRLDALHEVTVIDQLLDEVGLTEAADRPVGTYSRGMKQRLGLADALVKDPSVLILDEPTTSIDPEGVAHVLRLIRRLAEERGVAVLLSSHLLAQVQAVCDRVAIFVDGRVLAQGTPDELASAGSNTEIVHIQVDGTGDPVAALGSLPYVQTVEAVAGASQWAVSIERGAASRLIADAVSSGVALKSARGITDLDEVYRRYFRTGPIDV